VVFWIKAKLPENVLFVFRAGNRKAKMRLPNRESRKSWRSILRPSKYLRRPPLAFDNGPDKAELEAIFVRSGIPIEHDPFPYQISEEQLSEALARATEGTPVVVLADFRDVSIRTYDSSFIDIQEAKPNDLSMFAKSTLFVVAGLRWDSLIPWVSWLRENGSKFISVADSIPKGYLAGNSLAIDLLTSEWSRQARLGFDKWDYGAGDFVNLIQFLERTSDLDGAVVEIGCYRGSSSAVITRWVVETGQEAELFFIDTFEGFNYSQALESFDSHWQGTHVADSRETVEARLNSYLDPRDRSTVQLNVLKCNVVDSGLPDSARVPIRFANIDVDLYEAVGASLREIDQWVVPDGVIIVEDAGHTPLLIGARLALEEFLSAGACRRYTIVEMESGQVVLIRKT